MSRILMPARDEVLRLARVRSDACVSIYVETSPLRLRADESRIELGNRIREALSVLENAGLDKRRLAALKDEFDDVTGIGDFSLFQSNSLALLATPDNSRVYRLANHLNTQMEVSDRFYLKPLLRSLTFSHRALILALSENEVRVISLYPDSEPETLVLADMPGDAKSALGLASITASTTSAMHGDAATLRKRRLAEYCRKVDEALRPLVQEGDMPVILIAAEPIASLFRSVATVDVVASAVSASPDRLPEHELVSMARPALDAHYAREVGEVKSLFEVRAGQQRVVTDLADAARAATYGMISLAMIDFDYTATGYIDDNGMLTLSDEPEAYGIIDEIAKRALESGARILAVRAEDMIGGTGVAAILRYPLFS